MEKSVLIENLNNGIVTVQFTKKDGTERVMKCTRNVNEIPADQLPKGDKNLSEEKVETDNIKVFDIEANGWRSFNYSTVKF